MCQQMEPSRNDEIYRELSLLAAEWERLASIVRPELKAQPSLIEAAAGLRFAAQELRNFIENHKHRTGHDDV